MATGGRFHDRVVIVTGSSSGIGQATALEFAKEGASVVIHGQNEGRLNETEELLKKEGVSGERIAKVVGSLADVGTPKRIIDQAVGKFGKINVLINNAGVSNHPTNTDLLSLDTLDFLYRVNLRSVVELIQLAVPHLEKTRGCVVNVSSINSQKPSSRTANYCALKAGLDMLTRCYADLLGTKGIRVNTVNPGFIRTNIVLRQNVPGAQENFEAFATKNTCIGRVGMPTEIANVLKFLASDEASYVTGANWFADGGRMAFNHYRKWD